MKEELERVIAALEVEAVTIESHARRLLEMMPSLAGDEQRHEMLQLAKTRQTGQKQSRGKFACCQISSEAGRSNATFAAHGRVHDDIPAGSKNNCCNQAWLLKNSF